MHNTIFFIILIIPVTGFFIERYLEYLNSRCGPILFPKNLQGYVMQKNTGRAQLYQKEN